MEDIRETDIDVNSDTEVDEPAKAPKTEESKPLTFTQDELDTLINKRLDRASKKASEEKAEAEKLAKMSEADRQLALFEAEKVSFAEERKLYQKEKLELQVVKELSTKSLPTVFSRYLIGEDADTCMLNIKEFENKWSQAIANAVDERLKGKTPTSGTGQIASTTKEDFNKMTYKEKSKMFLENQELYKELIK